jgi:Leucine-rich repeat (LRR) protein
MEKEKITGGNLLTYNKAFSIDYIRETIEKKSLDGLFIHDVLDPLPSLDFLKDFTFLTHLRVHPIDDQDYSFLRHLTNLRSLSIGESVTNTHEIDLIAQTNLIYLGLHWRKNIKGLENCRKLESLMLTEFKEKDLSVIRKVPTIRELDIRTSSIKEMAGVEDCQSLESVSLGPCRSLLSISALNHHPNLKSIELEACNKISDYEKLTDLPVLEKLSITNCKIPSIQFITHIPSLKKLIMVGGTEVMNGDMGPVANVPEVQYSNRPHYNIPFPPPNLRIPLH